MFCPGPGMFAISGALFYYSTKPAILNIAIPKPIKMKNATPNSKIPIIYTSFHIRRLPI
jgi:hypothetical protein